MWVWIVTGVGAYLALLFTVVALAASARAADRRERALFATWLQERRKRVAPVAPLRSSKSRAA